MSIKKLYSTAEQEFVFQWADHWFQFVDMIIQLVRTDRVPPSPPPPTDLEKINYMRLHFWFIDHEQQFVSLWNNFYEANIKLLYEISEPLGIPDGKNYLLNPFSFCYRRENLYELVRAMDIQSGVDVWDPSEHRAWQATMTLIQMSAIVAKFHEWVCDEASNDSKRKQR